MSASVHAGIPHNPQEQTSPLEQTPPATEHAGRYGQHTGSMHPTGMQSSCVCTHAECLQMYAVSAPFDLLLNFP